MELFREKLISVSIFTKTSILNLRAGSKYDPLLYPWKSAKMYLLIKLSKTLHKCTSLFFLKLVVLIAAPYSKIFSNSQHLQQRVSWKVENICKSVISESLFRNLVVKIPEIFLLKCAIYVLLTCYLLIFCILFLRGLNIYNGLFSFN